ncbi:carnitine metabolism transcriptional regulator CaiF [Aeromonas hydrophila]
MCLEFDTNPFYLSVAQWVMEQGRWVSAKEISEHFDIPRCKATNTVTYILSEAEKIICETKTIPNQLEGSGCKCQRLLKVKHIDRQSYAQSANISQRKLNQHDVSTSSLLTTVPPSELNYEQKWQWMLSKYQRR